ncbi:MAG: antibiotic biosynthesis monooxygenase [Candidatus Competibacteraceae bacterium]|nr:antibiotic biosynthesis monooxygenase [Candidatus Competibacteraceae bacterium]
MSESTVHVVAHIIAKPDTVTALRAVLEALLPPTRQEAGCRQYLLLQNREHPTDFTVVEQWADATAIDRHLQSAHVQQALAQAAALLAAPPDIQRYELIG